MLGITDENNLFTNHILLIAKNIYIGVDVVRLNLLLLYLRLKLRKCTNLKTNITKSNNKWPVHENKWGKYVEVWQSFKTAQKLKKFLKFLGNLE